MALTATVYTIEIDLADHDRGVFESLAIRAARHPSESAEYFVTRVLAYALEYAEGIEFSKGGISDPEDPPIAVRDLTGAFRAWIEIGNPEAARLHKASKTAPRVAVYTHKDPAQLMARLAGERIHRAEAIDVWAMDRALVAALVERLERRMSFSLAVSERELSVSFADATLSGTIVRHRLP
ncbi:MAG TPA: YaeQ family protein [Vicinamibacterales bacterium]|nr:YaeQ family protein [Vicinamibacterales bacterium]